MPDDANKTAVALTTSPESASIVEIRSYLGAVRNRRLASGHLTEIAHSLVIPYATYSPWITDRPFRDDYDKVYKNTLVDAYRCYELWSLAGQALRTPGDILEVGVWRGGTGVLAALQARRVSPTAKVYLCDTFAGVVKAGAKDSYYKGGEHTDTSADIVRELVAQAGVENVEILVGMFPDDGGDSLAQKRFSFCHIDVDVYESGRAVFEWVWPKLNSGGIVVFDDYGFFMCDGITRLVNELAAPGRTLIHNLNGHAILLKA
jgi:O-methyltransferase